MTDLIVRNLDETIVRALKQRAARHNRSAEAEHRIILEQALVKSRRKPLADVLAAIPDVGEDRDFERSQEDEPARVFD